MLIVRDLGLQPYESVWEAMKTFTAERDGSVADELWCVQHSPVYTQGQAGKAEHILAPGDIPVVQADRGGQVTYHGPGQLVVYLMIDLPWPALAFASWWILSSSPWFPCLGIRVLLPRHGQTPRESTWMGPRLPRLA